MLGQQGPTAGQATGNRDGHPSLRITAEMVVNQADQISGLVSGIEFKLFGDSPQLSEEARQRSFSPDSTAGIVEDTQHRLAIIINTLQRIQNFL